MEATHIKKQALEAVNNFATWTRRSGLRITVSEPSRTRSGETRVYVDTANKTWRVTFGSDGAIAKVMGW